MNILITGASRGIGRAIAKNLDGEIFAVARNEALLKDFKNYFICDLSTHEGMKQLGDYIVENKIDVLINNAGEYVESNISKELNLEQLEHSTRLNLEAPLYLISRIFEES